MLEDVHVERIDLTGKQILVVTGLDMEEFQLLGLRVREWMASSDPVLMIYTSNGAEVRLEKVEC